MNKSASTAGRSSSSVSSTSFHKRRSLKGGPDLPEDIPQNDDEAEREQRRRVSGKFGQLAGLQVSLGGIADLSASELVAQYSNCMRLSAENKINHKNAFSLPLIDCMKVLLKKNDGQMDNFQIVGCTLDASAKIYASRVDRVHMDGMSFAKDLGGRAHLPASKNDGSGEDEPEGNADPSKKKKRKKRILSKDVSKINISFDATEPDPTYVVLSKQFSNCQPSFVSFIPRLNIKGDSSKVIMDMKKTFLYKEEDNIYRETDVEFHCVADENSQMVVPPFRDILTREVGDIDYDSLLNVTALDDSFPDIDDVIENENENDQLCDPFNENTILNGDNAMNADAFPGVRNNSTWNDEQEKSTRVRGLAKCGSREQVVDLQEVILNQVKNGNHFEYAYMNLERILFAGPTHWKSLPVSKGKVNSLVADGKKKKDKKVNIMDFNEIKDMESQLARSCTLTTSHIENNWTVNKVTKPVDLHFDPKNLLRYFNRPTCGIHVSSEQNNVEVLPEEDEDDNVYDYNNLNDSQQFCPAPELDPECNGNIDYSGECDNNGAAADVHSFEPTETNSDAWTMVDPPNKVARLAVPYAQQAKRIDMKALKTAIWKVLCENNMENGVQTPSQKKRKNEKIQNKDSTNDLMTGEIQFSVMERKVMNIVSSSMAQELTMPLIFTALLHLANEHNLSLQNVDDHSDINISQDSGTKSFTHLLKQRVFV